MAFVKYLRERRDTNYPVSDFAEDFTRSPLPFDGTWDGLELALLGSGVPRPDVLAAAKAAFAEYQTNIWNE